MPLLLPKSLFHENNDCYLPHHSFFGSMRRYLSLRASDKTNPNPFLAIGLYLYQRVGSAVYQTRHWQQRLYLSSL